MKSPRNGKGLEGLCKNKCLESPYETKYERHKGKVNISNFPSNDDYEG